LTEELKMLTEIPTGVFVIAIVASVLLVAGILSWLGIKQVSRSRELSHLERMKALEMGQAIGPSEAEVRHLERMKALEIEEATGPSEAEVRQDKYQHNVFWICFWIGAGVPIAATSAACSVEIQTNLQEFRIILAIWICVALISVASVVCATTLMISSRQRSSKGDKGSSENGQAV
jgi:uncharacterized membrane protein YidH (DUF202 family)